MKEKQFQFEWNINIKAEKLFPSSRNPSLFFHLTGKENWSYVYGNHKYNSVNGWKEEATKKPPQVFIPLLVNRR